MDEERMKMVEMDFALHNIPVEGEWYTAGYNYCTKQVVGIAGRDVKVVEVRMRPDPMLGRGYVETVVEDESGLRYDLPHSATQALYKREGCKLNDKRPHNPVAGIIALLIVCATILGMVYIIWGG